MSIVKELKELIKDLGGDASGVQTISEAVDKIPIGGSGGGSSNVMVLHRDENTTLDKTLREIIAALKSGTVVLVTWAETDDENDETVVCEPVIRSENSMRIFTASNKCYASLTLDGYPHLMN